jgi:hypothetical protein
MQQQKRRALAAARHMEARAIGGEGEMLHHGAR